MGGLWGASLSESGGLVEDGPIHPRRYIPSLAHAPTQADPTHGKTIPHTQRRSQRGIAIRELRIHDPQPLKVETGHHHLRTHRHRDKPGGATINEVNGSWIVDSPNDRHRVTSHVAVRSDDQYVVDCDLSDDDAVEGISVNAWQFQDAEGGSFVNRYRFDAVTFPVGRDVAIWRIGERYVPFSVLDDDLPRGC